MPLLQSAVGGLLPIVVLFLVLIAFTAWQGRRNLKKQQEQRSSLESGLTDGSRVVLNSGLFATVTHVGDKQVVVELAPGTEVTILKQAIVRIANPDEEEFAFADDLETAPEDLSQPGQVDADADATPDPVVPDTATTASPATEAAATEDGQLRD